jgi:ribosomal protein S27AE
MESILERLRQDYPILEFVESDAFYWSPFDKKIHYANGSPIAAQWSVLHETAHALLEHTAYSLDFELLQMEVAAWELAKELAAKYGIAMDDDHIQNCLDSYRDWLYKRSICPSCGNRSTQHDNGSRYQCFNCHGTWAVTSSRFCRPYRHSRDNEKSSATLIADDSFSGASRLA